MAFDELAAALYDFIYRDSGRVASYYAQLFDGRLTSIETLDQQKTGKLNVGKVSVKLLGGERSASEEAQTSIKRVVDPHDIATIDVLHRLVSTANRDPFTAEHHEIVLARGTIVFSDRSMLEIGAQHFEGEIQSERAKRNKERDLGKIAGMESIKNMMLKLALPSSFLLTTDDDVRLCGTIKESGMEEPISTYYFRHGMNGLPDVYVIGIKEADAGSPVSAFIDSPFMSAGRQTAEALKGLVFPPDAVRVMPIAMFRELRIASTELERRATSPNE